MADTASAGPVGRREMNRMQTRRAIVDAVLSLAESGPWSQVTLEAVAERAGVSKRTLFNYFPSLEDALHEPLRLLVARTAEFETESDESHGPVSMLQHVANALTAETSLELLDAAARVLLVGRDSDLHVAQLAVWEEAVQAVRAEVAEATPRMRLVIDALTRAAVGAAHAAFDSWAQELNGPVGPADVERLGALLAQTIGLVQSGFALPAWLTPDDLASAEITPADFG